MTEQLWTEVDSYLVDRLVPKDPDLEAALRASNEAGLPSINVAPNQGKLLWLLALATKAGLCSRSGLSAVTARSGSPGPFRRVEVW